MKKRKKLGFIEKIVLHSRAKHDIESNAFEDYKSHVDIGSFLKNLNQSNIEDLLIVSTFMLHEMDRFKNFRNYFVNYKRFLVCVYDEKLNKEYKVISCRKAIDFIDSQIKYIDKYLSITEESREQEIKYFDDQLIFIKNNVIQVKGNVVGGVVNIAEWEMLYNQKKHDCEVHYLELKQIAEKRRVLLENEKDRICKKIYANLQSQFSYQYLRISTYFKYAQDYSGFLPCACVSGSRLKEICEIDFSELSFNYEEKKQNKD